MDSYKTDRKDHILNVAEKVFLEHGFDGASTRMISGEAGVNLAMLNYYFGSKEGLFLAIFERRISSYPPLLQIIGNNEQMTSWEKLAKCIDNFIESIMVNDCFHELISRELAIHKHWDVTDRIAELIMKNVYEVRLIIDEGVNNGMFNKETDVGMITAVLFGAKSYIMNNPHISSVMVGYDIKDENILEGKLKPRIKLFIKNLLKAYLLCEKDSIE